MSYKLLIALFALCASAAAQSGIGGLTLPPILPAAATPTITPGTGTFSTAQSVVLATVSPLAAVHYTVDGSTPTCSSPTYAAALTVSSTLTIRAVACGLIYSQSPVNSAAIAITLPLPLVLPTVFFPANGSLATHPYNVPATSFPDDTRCFVKVGGCTPIAASVDQTTYSFGSNYIALDDSMPWTVVDSGIHPELLTTLHVDDIFGDAPYTVANVPIRGVPIEGGLRKCVANGGTDDGHDHHGLPYDVRTKLLWEAYQVCTTTGDTTGEYHTATFANPAWDATRFNPRPLGQDSVEAAGREVVPWTLRWQELNSGEVKHAVRFTPKFTRGSSGDDSAFAFPAVHGAGNNGDSPFYQGQRFRFDCSKHLTNDGTDICSDAYLATLTPPQARFIRMLRDYGMVVADNSGGGYYITCDNDPAWDNFQWTFLHIKLGDFLPVNSAPVTDIHGNSLTQ